MYNLFKFCISVHLINCFECSWVTHMYLVAWFFKIPSYVINCSVSPGQDNPEFSFFGSKNSYEKHICTEVMPQAMGREVHK